MIQENVMQVSTKHAGLALALTAAALFGCSAIAADKPMEKTASVQCVGANSCKGTSECKTASNECKGQNSCKGHGWVKAANKAECVKMGGMVK